jgi:N-acetylglucosamine-6-phosphate deacetylase
MADGVPPAVDSYIDLQVNGYMGVDFNNPALQPQDIVRAAKAMKADRVKAAFPTVITASPEAMCRCIQVLSSTIDAEPSVAEVFKGIHVEGPFLSDVPGFVGAHPVEFAGRADLRLLDEMLDCGNGHIRLLTLAPEVDVSGRLIKHCVKNNIEVAAGHTDCSVEQLQASIDHGLRYFTHLGNACPVQMHRHDNVLLRGLSLAEQLRITVIADGHHIPAMLFRMMLDWVPEQNLAVVSDAISAAGLGAGTFDLGGRSVEVRPDLAAWDAAGQHFVGAASRMPDADAWMARELQLSHETRQRLCHHNPMNWFFG